MRARAGNRRGHSVIEVALMAPWIFFLFVGIFDFGFYAYALICVENAARVAVMYTSLTGAVAGDSGLACTQYVLPELQRLPGTKNCGGNVAVSATPTIGPDGNLASRVSVTYEGGALIPIPGLVDSRMSITRTAEMRVILP